MNVLTNARISCLTILAAALLAAGCGGSEDNETAAASTAPVSSTTPTPVTTPITAPAPSPSVMPVYLLAGQSNMVGAVDQDLFDNLLTELANSNAPNLEKRLDDRLKHWYFVTNNGYASYGYSASLAKFQITELIRLHREGLVGDQLKKPHPNVMCSFNGKKIAPLKADCGSPFGPELMMGHVLSKTLGSPTSLIKVAEGGTTLMFDWTSPSRTDQPVGAQYKLLSARIKSLATQPAEVHPNCASKKCQWAAFVYFQGENDAFDIKSAAAYEKNLRTLISDVRKEVGNPNLPTVIVQVGAWGGTVGDGELVAAAQKKVAESDAYARLVVTSDLSGFYHYDPASQLIIGERVAKAVQALTSKEPK